MKIAPTNWLALVVSLPTQNATDRMRIWRALKALGCVILRDGVYLLPMSTVHDRALSQLADDTRRAGGSAHLLQFTARDGSQEEQFRQLFDRSDDYARCMDEIAGSRASFPSLAPATVRRMMRGLRRNFNALAQTDFFPAPIQAQARAELEALDAAATKAVSPGRPQAAAGKIRRVERADYQARRWATRKHLWVDRMASAWLIGRFIDPQATFLWLDSPADCPSDAIGFDFEEATFTHVGDRVTFETLLNSFGLEDDRALSRLADLVHYLDVGGARVPEATGVETLLAGARQSCPNDDALLDEARKTFDFLYTAYAV
jgi:hypothetical protein